MAERPAPATRQEIDSARLIRWYDAQARFYSLRRDRHDGAHVLHVAARLAADRPLTILDAGCGTGLFSIGLASRSPGWKVLGIDASRGMLEVARRKASERKLANVTFAEGDVYELPFEAGHFDVVCAAGVLPNLNDHARALREWRRVLRTDGLLFVIEIDREALTGPQRLRFRTMILGQRVIAALLPRFRFARRWTLERSTVERDATEALLRECGLRVTAVDRTAGHLVFEART